MLPRYAKVPGNPSVGAAARWAVRRLGVEFSTASMAFTWLDNMLEFCLALVALLEWFYAGRVKAALEQRRKSS